MNPLSLPFSRACTALFVLLGPVAHAQSPSASLAPVPAATPFVDVHPFQSQTMLRSTEPGINHGTIEILPAVTVAQYTYRQPGVSSAFSELDTALLYDRKSALPTPIALGINYAFYDAGRFATLSATGSFTSYTGISFKPSVIGGVFFVDSLTQHLIVIDSYGYFVDTFMLPTAMAAVGGNYFIDTKGLLTTIKSAGIAAGNNVGMVTEKTGDDFSGVKVAGGNYFEAKDGSVYTVSAITGFYDSTLKLPTVPKIVGGNYFVATDNSLYTIDNAGIINCEFNYRDAAGKLHTKEKIILSSNPTLQGYSFLKFADGTFILIDGSGVPHRSYMHVNQNGSVAKPESQFLPNVDANAVYQPKPL